MPAPATFTGEDCAELHAHGGRAVVAALLQELAGYAGLRLAEAGEFTRRAFLNGKIDLSQAEALADLVAAETEAQRRLAAGGTSGELTRLYGEWRGTLVHARAMIEAELDFADEADVPGSVSDVVWDDLQSLRVEIARHLGGYRRAELIRDGYRIAIAGPPNVGKSSLLNALAQREAAIVSDVAGTTRDIIDVVLDLNGFKVIVSDTAGLRQSEDRVEAIGVEKAIGRIREADLVLSLVDLSAPEPQVPLLVIGGRKLLRVGTKADLPRASDPPELDCRISVRTGQGMSALLERIATVIEGEAGGDLELLPSRLRHVKLLEACLVHIDRAADLPAGLVDLKAEELRLASDQLGRIAGRIEPDHLLDTIFSSFCIGK